MQIFLRSFNSPVTPRFSGGYLCVVIAWMIYLPGIPLSAQVPAPKQNNNLIPNGNFEKSTSQPTLWYGVDSEGYLAGTKGSAVVLAKTGSLAAMAMPVSVCMADINGDGLPDLITADPTGYVRAYINAGTKTEPKFSQCEMIPFFLARYNNMVNDSIAIKVSEFGRRGVQRINLYDWGHRGMNDLLIGDYGGQIFFFPNTGTATSPNFRQPVDVNDGLIPTAAGGSLWGTVFSPTAFDWDKSGKPDLLIGEGSYSANAVHLLLNRGTGSKPDFEKEQRYYLAYGDGREQLVSTVADYNGDGEPDLLVADREGTVGAYLNPGSWKPGAELNYASNVSFGNITSFAAPVTIYAADYNGDGLFDVIIGKNNGRIAVAINRGTKELPKFDAPVEIKGDPEWGKYIANAPDVWQCDSGITKGNMYSYFSVVGAEDKNAASPRSAHVLKAAYFPCPNKVFKQPDLAVGGLPFDNSLFYLYPQSILVRSSPDRNSWTPTRTFMLHVTPSAQLKIGSTYTISFNIKGSGMKDGHWIMGYGGHKENTPAQIQRGERGSAIVTRDFTNETNMDAAGSFTANTSWVTVNRTFTVKFKDPKLKDLTTTSACALEISFVLTPYEGVVYVDDVQLVEKN